MVWTALAEALPAITGGGGGGGLLGGLLGGGETKVSQNASNSTTLNVTSLLSNQGQGDPSASASGSSSASAQSATGSDAPALSPAGYGVPLSGFDSLGAEDSFNSSVDPTAIPKQAVIAAGVIVAGLGAFALFGKKRKR